MSFPGHIIDPVARAARAEADSADWTRYHDYEASRLTRLHQDRFDEVDKAEEDLRSKVIVSLSTAAIISVGIGLIALSLATWPIALCVFGIALCVGLGASSLFINCSSESHDKEALENEIEQNACAYASRIVLDDI